MNKLLLEARAVIFDVDGLLVDSEPLWDKAREVFAQKYNKIMPPDVHDHVRGMGMREVVQVYKDRLGIEGDLDSLAKEFRETFYEVALLQKQLQTMKGASELIHQLHKTGKVLAIATGGHSKERMKEILQVFYLQKYFVCIVSSDQVKNGKPAPDIFLFTANQLHIAKEDCVILEDAANGVEAAKNAEMKVIAVQKNLAMREKIGKLQPDLLVESLEDLYA